MPQLAIKGGVAVCAPLKPSVETSAESISEVTLQSFCNTFASYHECSFGIPVCVGESLSLVTRAMLPLGSHAARAAYSSSLLRLPSGVDSYYLDVLEDRYTVDPFILEKTIRPDLDLIIAEHLGGIPCNMDAVMYAARNNDCIVIEDCSQAIGAEWAGTRVGSFGECGCFHLPQFECDIITTDNPDINDRLSTLSLNRENRTVDVELFFERLFLRDNRRSETAAFLRTKLESTAGIWPLKTDDKVSVSSNEHFVFRYHSDAFDGADKELFIQAMIAEGIPAKPGPESLSDSAMVAIQAAEFEAVWLPGWILDDRKNINYLLEAIGKIQQHKAELAESDV